MRLGIEPARFVPRLLLALAVCLPLWILCIPIYNRVLATGLTLALPLAGEGGRTAMVWKDYILVTTPKVGTRQNRPEMEGFRGYLATYNAPLLVALVLATPGVTTRHRLRALVAGGLVLYALHLIYYILEIKHFPYLSPGGTGSDAGWGYRWGVELYLTIAAQLIPIVLWVIFLRYQAPRQPANDRQAFGRGKARRSAAR
jgi:hypothetical protein